MTILNIAVFYDQYSTHTNTVFDHLDSLQRYSDHNVRYFHGEGWKPFVDLKKFDIVVIHYSLRVAFQSIHPGLDRAIQRFKGLKVLFVQDEYDNTNLTIAAIERLGISLVYTCVPAVHHRKVYPVEKLADVEFVSTLTGFSSDVIDETIPRVSDRSIDLGYRGRELPFWYGDLGREKSEIGEGIKRLLRNERFKLDIECDDRFRIYGDDWIKFLRGCRAVLGTESGCNLFDFDGELKGKFLEVLRLNPELRYSEAREMVLGVYTEPQIMNQISPRIFEAAQNGCAMVLFEGEYSGLIYPEKHFFPLKKDFSNVDDLKVFLGDFEAMQAMVDRTFERLKEVNQTLENFSTNFSKKLIEKVEEKRVGLCRSGSDNLGGSSAPNRFSYKPPSGLLLLFWRSIPIACRSKLKPFGRQIWDFVQTK